MSVPAAYIAVILVWSTTPLGLQWSSQGLSPVAGAFSRMLLAAIFGWMLVWLFKIKVPRDRPALRVYLASNIGLCLGLFCVYIGAVYLPTGLISVLFGLSPIASAVLARALLSEPPFTVSKWVAVLMGLGGLMMTFDQDIQFSNNTYFGIVLVLSGMLCFSLSGVLIKRERVTMHPLAQTVGSISLAAVFYGIIGSVIGFQIDSPQPKAIAAILYLALFGSFVGFICYFYVLKHMAASSVALVTLITPVIAIALGVFFNGEQLSSGLIIGAMLICGCLLVFYWGDAWLYSLGISKRPISYTNR